MGIGKGKSDNIDIDGLMENMDDESKAGREENALANKVEELKRARQALEAATGRLEETTRKMDETARALRAANESTDNIVTGIGQAIADARQKTVFTARLGTEDLEIFRELYKQMVTEECDTFQAHREKQDESLKEHERRLADILRRNKGIWLADKWLKFLIVSGFLYNVIIALYIWYLKS